MAIEINSASLIPIDSSFRLKAGPGAGKTYWLINHVRQVVEKAQLGMRGKIACITYSNVGADTIAARLGKCDKVDVCTIHSFLYANLIKPFLFYISQDFGFNYKKFNGVVDDYVLSDYSVMEDLKNELRAKNETSKIFIDNDLWADYLSNLRWHLKEDGKMSCKSSRPIMKSKNKEYPAPSSLGIMYKKKAWSYGILHYDDVNFFAHKILQKFPFLCKVIADAYPYIFIDEFQDTNPIQSDIIQKIGYAGGNIGVIGDVCQSIYRFMGSSPKSFIDFKVPGLKEYVIKGNRRSTKNIVNFLNAIRTDLKQEAIINEEGDKVCFLIGSKEDAFNHVTEKLGMDVAVLSYTNIETNAIRYKYLEKRGTIPSIKIKEFKDSNAKRYLVVMSFVKAIEHARSGKFRKAFSLLERAGLPSDNAVNLLRMLLSLSDLDNWTMLRFVENLIELGIDIPRITKGKPKEMYLKYTYAHISQTVSIEDDEGNQRTIHKSKGDEFENVLVLLGNSFEVTKFFDFNLLNMKNESNRVYYVAMSRAKRRLFVNLQSLSYEMEQKLLNHFDIDIKRI